MNGPHSTPTRHATDGRVKARAPVLALCLALLALGACSEDASPPLAPARAAPLSAGADGHPGHPSPRVVGSLLRAPHSWPIVNWSSIRGLNATLDRAGEPDGSYALDIEIDFGDGPFLQQTTEEVICLEIAERGDGTTDIWMSSAGLGWVTVPPGVTHYAVTHIVDSPGADLITARSIQPEEGPPSEFCETRPDLAATDPTGFGPAVPMAAEAGNVVSLNR